MRRVVTIVEGHGEVEAVPILLRRVTRAIDPNLRVELSPPIRIGRNKIVREGELERAVELAARRAGPEGGILIILDADDDCPKHLAPGLLERATLHRPDRRIRVVLATREFEAWFIAAADSLVIHGLLTPGAKTPPNPEELRDAKGWLSRYLSETQSYREARHQARFTAVFDLVGARARSASFDKFWRDVEWLLGS